MYEVYLNLQDIVDKNTFVNAAVATSGLKNRPNRDTTFFNSMALRCEDIAS